MTPLQHIGLAGLRWDHQDDQIGRACGLTRSLDSQRLQSAGLMSKSCRAQKRYCHTLQLKTTLDGIPSGAGVAVHEGSVFSEQSSQQPRLARVNGPYEC